MFVRWLLAPLALGAVLYAQTGVRISPRDSAALVPPKNVVRRYCEMDAQGFRLNPEQAKRIVAVTTAASLPETHSFDVIARYEITAARPNARGVEVTVTYQVIGHFEDRVGFVPGVREDTLEFQAIPEGDDWKVEDQELLHMPRVMKAHTVRWLQSQLANEKDPDVKRSFEEAIRVLL